MHKPPYISTLDLNYC